MLRVVGLAAVVAIIAVATSANQASAFRNPASVFCIQSGGKSEIRNGPRGQYGVCRLPNGRVVNEWTYFRQKKGRYHVY